MKYHQATELCHHGILGQKWGVRRFQDKSGRLTAEGKARRQEYEEAKIKADKAKSDYNNAKSKYREIQKRPNKVSFFFISPRKEGKMAKKELSILDTIKKQIGIVPDYDAFDDQILMDINAAFATLHQLGVGPEEGFLVEADTDWDEYISTERLSFIKSYVSMKVRVMFDPPTSSFALDALNKQIAEYEWRITSEVECYGQED